MKMKNIIFFLIVGLALNACSPKKVETNLKTTVITNIDVDGTEIQLDFEKGEYYNHPLIAVWLEDKDGKFVESVYVAKSMATGVFGHGGYKDGKWVEGTRRRAAALPYWSHQRGIKAVDGLYLPTPEKPLADAITGPTPSGDFILKSKLMNIENYRILVEVNQPWDWNNYWHNNKYPDSEDYKSSCQPSVVYEANLPQNLES